MTIQPQLGKTYIIAESWHQLSVQKIRIKEITETSLLIYYVDNNVTVRYNKEQWLYKNKILEEVSTASANSNPITILDYE